MNIWDECEHEWEEIESQFSNEKYIYVKCKKCGCPGEKDLATGDVFWPAT